MRSTCAVKGDGPKVVSGARETGWRRPEEAIAIVDGDLAMLIGKCVTEHTKSAIPGR